MPELEIYEIVNILGLLLGIVFGAIAQKTQFCFSGSIKDYILTKSTRRASSVIMAIIVAIISTTIISNLYEIDLTQTTFFKSNINYIAIILGGALFGIGMMLADGCGNRQLIKFAQGDINALITIVFIAIFAYATTKGFIFSYANMIINNPFLIDISSKISNSQMNIYLVLIPLFGILFLLTKKLSRIFTLIDGVIVGILIALAWGITGVIGEESLDRVISLTGITFVYPTAKSLELFMYYEVNELTFAITTVCGVILGAFLMSKKNKRYSFGCTAGQNINRVKYNIIGGALMGMGGILSIGCTVGQGLTGMSTLAFASLIAIVSIFISATITAKILNKNQKLPMCFLFDWEDEKTKNIDYQI